MKVIMGRISRMMMVTNSAILIQKSGDCR